MAEPGSAPAFGPGNYCCRLNDPDGYLVEVCVAHELSPRRDGGLQS